MPNERLTQVDDADDDIGRGHQLADEQKERDCHQRFGIDAVEQLADDGRQTDRRKQRADEDAGHQGESHRHAAVAEHQEKAAHQPEDQRVVQNCSWRGGGAKPRREPLTNCSSVNRTTKTPLIGIAAYQSAIGVSEGMRKLPNPWVKLIAPK
jgi:hypothetical protein